MIISSEALRSIKEDCDVRMVLRKDWDRELKDGVVFKNIPLSGFKYEFYKIREDKDLVLGIKSFDDLWGLVTDDEKMKMLDALNKGEIYKPYSAYTMFTI